MVFTTGQWIGIAVLVVVVLGTAVGLMSLDSAMVRRRDESMPGEASEPDPMSSKARDKAPALKPARRKHGK